MSASCQSVWKTSPLTPAGLQPTADDVVALACAGGGGNLAFPVDLRRRIEGFFGTDLRLIRLHVMPTAVDWGCRALAMGRDIYLSASVLEGERAEFEATIVHEIAHSLQQASGRVVAPEPGLLVDPTLEAAG